MDHRCPACGFSLARRKLVDAVITSMERECGGCKRRLRLNLHRVEQAAVIANFAAVLGLGALAYVTQSQPLMMATFGLVLLGSLALPLLERTYLRSWPRYVLAD